MVVPLVFHSSGELELALELKTSLFYRVCADWRRAGHAEIQGLGKGAQQTEKYLPDLVETTSVSGDRGLINYFKIGN